MPANSEVYETQIPLLCWETASNVKFVVAMTREGKIRMRNRNMPAVYGLTVLLILAALPMLWYALYRL